MRDGYRQTVSAIRNQARYPPVVTTATIVAVIYSALRFHVFSHELATDVGLRFGFSPRALTTGHASTLLTSQFLSRDSFMAISLSVSLMVMLGLYEMIAGSTRTLVVTATTAVAGPLIVSAILGIGSALGNDFAGRTLSTLDYGASAVTAGGGGAFVAALRVPKLRRFAMFWVASGLIIHHQFADWEHLGSFAIGYALGRYIPLPKPTSSRAFAPSDRRAIWQRRLRHTTIIVALPAMCIGAPAFANHMLPALDKKVVITRVTTIKHGTKSTTVLVKESVTSSRTELITYPTPSMGGTRHAYVVLPPGYDTAEIRYPVVELLHGFPGAPNDLISALDPASIETAKHIPQFILVAPDGNGPQTTDSEFADTPHQRIGSAIATDLQRWVNHRYRTNHRWGVAGVSAGGYGAAYLASHFVGRYQAACSLSGSFVASGRVFNGTNSTLRKQASPLLQTNRNGPRTYLLAGAQDPTTVRDARLYAKALSRHGQQYVLRIGRGGHDWNLWKRALPHCIQYLLGNV